MLGMAIHVTRYVLETVWLKYVTEILVSVQKDARKDTLDTVVKMNVMRAPTDSTVKRTAV